MATKMLEKCRDYVVLSVRERNPDEDIELAVQLENIW